ncbi:hypothetical protein Athai_37530 [Actinocatenispora thailandica]|uniref:Uncharacterized protein n=1 Tax=Actinocatenispora thailandica TaxID=227318 RepID=A0A7R7DQY8_9ACTN|nr:hypothetical protein [Actinocatenispora thailandica]BCJ36250.1 hypothetical protein Athai_37530 [Actinocatenispora thailandica]
MRTEPVRRWAELVAHLIPLVVLPSGLWRLALAFGLPTGALAAGAAPQIGVGTQIYIVCLTLLSESVALLSFGLVRPWGEVFPRWLPLIGGRPVRRWFATTVASTGALALAGLWAFAFVNYFDGNNGIGFTTPFWHAVFLACYLPVTLWVPLLVALIVAYHRRRGQNGTSAARVSVTA